MEKLLKELLEANRYQRHDFLNHLQVIWGFLKIKKEDKAITYMQDVTDYLQGLRELNNIGNIELAADVTAKILSIGLKKKFRVSVPESWNIADENIPKVRYFLNEFWEKLVQVASDEVIDIKLAFKEGKIILDVHNINDDFPWEVFSSIGDKYEIENQVEDNVLTYLVEG